PHRADQRPARDGRSARPVAHQRRRGVRARRRRESCPAASGQASRHAQMPDSSRRDSGGAGAGRSFDGSFEARAGVTRRGRKKKAGGSEAMTWATFYLVCLIVGAALSALSFVGGTLHLPHLHVHLPHGHPALSGAAGGSNAAMGRGSDLPFVNFATLTIFLAWFGGAGYLLTEHSTLIVVVI